ncbi:outer membrane beta-barrel protein [Kordiimonas laminariae]|uniref:outer membrane beta-barrel protein n=1 Tax=Kordiimonas laminariae TaxID=2917717 RepID=UPI001FF3B625|nr:outer membrane beta-barrel protein [Kordiimonas laminariae]MCK0069375.1 outer membrane beta-barrel protein [Kordiimonas laminariae]
MKSTVLKLAATALLGSTAMATAAFAQQSDEQVQSVFERYRPDYTSVGIRTGSFIFSPTIGAEGKFNSNIFAQDNDSVDTTDDFIAVIKPSLALVSDWNRGFLSLTADADIARYADNSTEDFEDIRLNAQSRIDITRGSNITFNVGYSDLHEDRGAPDSNGQQDRPTTFSIFSTDVGYTRDEGLVSFAVTGSYENFDFDDTGLVGGGIFNNDDRDRERTEGTVRVGYDLNEDYEAFVKFAALKVKYDDSREDGGPLRDSDGWSVVGGAAFDLGGKSEGEFYVGYQKRDFDSASLGDSSEFIFGASVLWAATGLTSVKLGVDRDVNETTVGQNGLFASGTLDTSFSLRAEHELQRNVLLGADVSYTKQDYIGVGREDDVYLVGAEAKYLMNRLLSMKASYNFEKRNTNADQQDYNRHVFMVGLTAAW